MAGILNYTTTIAAEKTAAEIIALLAIKGAGRVTQTFGEKGAITGIGFVFQVGKQPVYFELPANEAGLIKYMLAEANAKKKQAWKNLTEQQVQVITAQARRTAWRILKDWIEVQIALVESKQAEMGQVFMPYAQDNAGRTMYSLFVENSQRQLGSGA